MIYVTADIHGKNEMLMQLLEKAGFREEGDDRLYIVGDAIDRHGGGVELLKWCMAHPQVTLLLGNHERMMLACRWLFDQSEDRAESLTTGQIRMLDMWKQNGGNVSIEALRRESPEAREAIFTYLEACPLYATVNAAGQRFVLVHGGLGNFDPNKPLELYSTVDLLWTRPYLTTVYDPRAYTVILGHTPTYLYGEAYRNRMLKNIRGWWNIDTGAACEEGSPMLLCLDTLEEFYLDIAEA
jgi:serine/threonine protein phosphatase 1